MIDTILIFIIFIVCIIKNSPIVQFKSDSFKNDFNKNKNLFNKLAEQIKNILKNNLSEYIRLGSTACGTSIGSSDLDIGVLVHNFDTAVKVLQENGYCITKEYDHFINLTKYKNIEGLDTDVKIYRDKTELYRLENAIEIYTKNVKLTERYWLIAQKIYFNMTNNTIEYNKAKIAFCRKHKILKDR